MPAWSRKLRQTGLRLRDYGSATGALVQRQEMRYGSQGFLAASDLARCLPQSAPAPALIGNLARRPALLRGLAAVVRLPVTDIQVRKADADAWWFREWFVPRRQLAWAVLDLPTAKDHYLTGRHRQALRTNLRHARARGVTSSRVSYETWSEAAGTIMRARDLVPGPEYDRPGPGQQAAFYVARAACGEPLAFAEVALFGQFAALALLMSRTDRQPDSSWARYQLHTSLVLDLSSCGTKHLLTGSALTETKGTQYFQHLLGYQARNLRVRVTPSRET
jgi:hypothetical protein